MVMMTSNCISFSRSLELLVLDNKAGAYGLNTSDTSCDVSWEAYQREGWYHAIGAAESEISRDLGAPLCPREICNELHPFAKEIRVRQSPIAYVGAHVFSVWTEAALTLAFLTSDDEAYIEICDSDIPAGASIDDFVFSYPDAVLDCYRGDQCLQEPCITPITDMSCGGGENGYRVTWKIYQVIDPAQSNVMLSDPTGFLTNVKWRVASIDTSLAVSYVGRCNCVAPTITATISDAIEGLICLDCGDNNLLSSCPQCSSAYDYIHVNYATAFDCQTKIDPALEQAIVYLALINAGDTASKPCGCDNTMIDRLLTISEVAGTEFLTKLNYGPTNAGIAIMRIINKFKDRPHFNEAVFSGGMFAARSGSKNSRRPSFLRGY